MSIDPTTSGGVNPYDAARTAQSSAARDQRKADQAPADTKPRSTGDSVQLSAASRNLVETAQAPTPVDGTSAAGLTAERLKQVLERMQTGHYDSAEVRDRVAHGIARDLGQE